MLIMIMIIAIMYIFLSYVVFDQKLRITFRKSSGPPEKIYSAPPLKIQKVQVPPFCHLKTFQPPPICPNATFEQLVTRQLSLIYYGFDPT